MSLEVGFLFELFDVIAIGFAIGPPVDVADFVARIVLAMLGELDAEAFVRALVNAGEETFDEGARDEREAAVFSQRSWIEANHDGRSLATTCGSALGGQLPLLDLLDQIA